MKRQLKPSGNGWTLCFTKPLLKLLGYNPLTTKVLLTAKNNTICIEPINENDSEIYQDCMVRKFQKNGGSYAIYLPLALIEILNIDPAYDYIDVEINVNKLMIKKFSEQV